VNFTYTDTLTSTTCGVCGMRFAAPETWLNQKREDGTDFRCPNGHSLSFGEGPLKKTERELAAVRAKLDQEQMASRTAALERDKAQKANLRLRKRAKAGVCSFCNRTFSQLADHMKCKHAGVKA